MQNVLVTGATGFIGKQLLQHLLHKNLKIRILVRDLQKTSYLPKEIDIVKGDLTQPESLSLICKNIDTVFHLGGYAHAWDEINNSFSEQHHCVNFLGTKNILENALREKVKRFIFFSSVKAVTSSETEIDETWEKLPNSPYGIAKREAEKLVLTARSDSMHVCILRPALVYGPGWKGNLASMLRAIDLGFFLPLPKVNNCRSMISIDDICHAAILSAENQLANGKIYFVTDGATYSTRQLYVLICQALGKRVPKWHVPLWIFTLLAIAGDAGKKLFGRRMPFCSEAISKLFGSAQYSSKQIANDLGFKPIYDFKKMLPKIIEKYRTQ